MLPKREKDHAAKSELAKTRFCAGVCQRIENRVDEEGRRAFCKVSETHPARRALRKSGIGQQNNTVSGVPSEKPSHDQTVFRNDVSSAVHSVHAAACENYPLAILA